MENAEGPPAKDAATEQQMPPQKRMTCPKCGSSDVRRSHTEGIAAAMLRVFGKWPYRCRSCRSRFYNSTPPE